MAMQLQGCRVAALVTNGFEEEELTEPKRSLRAARAAVDVVSPRKDRVRAWKATRWAWELPVDVFIDQARVSDYDALLLPGGTMSVDFLRLDRRAVAFVRSFAVEGKLIAAISHAPWLLVEAEVVRGRYVTSFASLRTDLLNAGAKWIDQEVVVDGPLITSRKGADLPAFCRALLRALHVSRAELRPTP